MIKISFGQRDARIQRYMRGCHVSYRRDIAQILFTAHYMLRCNSYYTVYRFSVVSPHNAASICLVVIFYHSASIQQNDDEPPQHGHFEDAIQSFRLINLGTAMLCIDIGEKEKPCPRYIDIGYPVTLKIQLTFQTNLNT